MKPPNETGFEGLVLLFNARGTASTGARLHAAACPMVRTGSAKHIAKIEGEDVAGDVADLEERGWKVVRCKCCKAPR